VGVTSRPLGGRDAPRGNLPPVGRAGCRVLSRRGPSWGPEKKISTPRPLDGRDVEAPIFRIVPNRYLFEFKFFNPFFKKSPWLSCQRWAMVAAKACVGRAVFLTCRRAGSSVPDLSTGARAGRRPPTPSTSRKKQILLR
jgi:hypothetical protein